MQGAGSGASCICAGDACRVDAEMWRARWPAAVCRLHDDVAAAIRAIGLGPNLRNILQFIVRLS